MRDSFEKAAGDAHAHDGKAPHETSCEHTWVLVETVYDYYDNMITSLPSGSRA